MKDAGLANRLRDLSYNAGVRKVARTLGLSSALRRVYQALLGPDQPIRISVAGTTAIFQPSHPDIVRILEPIQRGDGEHRVLQAFLESVRPGDTVLDVGANVGLYAILAAKRVKSDGTVHAVEPVEGVRRELETNARLNGAGNLKIWPIGFGEDRGELSIVEGDNIGATRLSQDAGPDAEGVDVWPADAFLQEKGLDVPDVVKIDVEGHELAALDGMERTLAGGVRTVVVEIHPTVVDRPDLRARARKRLERVGFDVRSLGRRSSETHLLAEH